jgi:hypothetical protein
MHNSDSPEKETAAVRLYLDESGGDDPRTPYAVVGGVLINQSHFLHFEEAWDLMLEKHGIAPPLHMREFGPHGRFANMTDRCRHELFLEVAALINSHKIFSIAATLSNEEYKTNFPKEGRDRFSVYGMCFILSVMINHKLAAQQSYGERTPFILDAGNPYKQHVVEAHASALRLQEETFLHVGLLTFDDDKEFGILQAADVIAWGVRRRATQISLGAFEPVADILKEEKNHAEASWKSDWIKELGDALIRRIAAGSADL